MRRFRRQAVNRDAGEIAGAGKAPVAGEIKEASVQCNRRKSCSAEAGMRTSPEQQVIHHISSHPCKEVRTCIF